MLEFDTEIGSSVFMDLLQCNQWFRRYIKDEAEYDLCTVVGSGGWGRHSAEPGFQEMAT